jgi:hypothetical protein
LKIKAINSAFGLLICILLSGCLDGGGASPPPTLGTVNVSISDGAADDYDHVWVTIKAISFHTDPDIVWNINNSSWRTTTLAAPVTLDLASLTNGALNQVFSGIQIPVGTYTQIRLFMAGSEDVLTASAQAAGLNFNDQVDYTDLSVTPNVVHHVPLELAYPTQGIQLIGSFKVTAANSLNLALDFDLEHDLVTFAHNSENYFTLMPNLSYFDLDQAGAIVGNVNPAQLCSTVVLSTCGYNLVVKAEILSLDGSRHLDTRATRVNADGSFSLYPLPSGTNYDVLIRGRNIETLLIKGVPAPLDSLPGSGATSLSTSNAPLQLTINNSEYFANFNASLTPSSGYAVFQQTLPTSGNSYEVPYEVRWGNTNPYNGILQTPLALSSGPLHVASYTAGTTLAFSNITSQEGLGNYVVASRGLPLDYYNTSTSTVNVNNPGSTNTILTPLLVYPPSPMLNVSQGTVTGSITQTMGLYNKGYLVLTRFTNIVNTVDISAALNANMGTYSVTLPAGNISTFVPGAYYYAYLRVWNSSQPKATLKIIPLNSMIDLRNTSTITGLNIILP